MPDNTLNSDALDEERQHTNPLNGRGTAMVAAGPTIFGICEAIYHANPFVGGAIALYASYASYKHFDDVARKFHSLKEGILVNIPHKQDGTQPQGNTSRRLFPKKTAVDIATALIPIGTTRSGTMFERTLKHMKNILILGLMEGGKTNTAIHIIRYMVKYGARLAIIDKHARSEEDSMTQKIQCLEACFDCRVGADPDSSLAVVDHVRNVFDARLAGASCSYPLVLVVDEFTAIMRQQKEGGKWQACGQKLVGLVEDINTEGRKHKVFCICIGQIANVSRTGGSEIRELFTTRIAHAMSKDQAGILDLTEEKNEVQALKKGEVFFKTEGTEAFFLKIPYVQEKDLKKLASTLRKKETDPSQELAEMPDVDPDDSRYGGEQESEQKIIPIGRDNKTKQEVGIPKQTFDMLVRMRMAGKLSGFREIQELLDCSETHARNINKLVDEACENGRPGGREGD